MKAITRVRPFRSGNSQAIRLPKDVAFPDGTELVLVRNGDVMTIYPAKISITDMLARMDALPAPGSVEIRDTDEIPGKDGL